MLKKIVLWPQIAALALMLATPATAVADKDGVRLKRKAIPFLVKMHISDRDRTIAENGNIRVSVQCDYNNPAGVSVRIIGISTEKFAGPDNFMSLNLSDTEIPLFRFVTSGDDVQLDNEFDKGSFVQDGSHYIGIDAETTSLGVNIFDFDCFTAGTAVLIWEEKRRPRWKGPHRFKKFSNND